MMKNIKKFDYFVIGGGSGGLASAKQAAKYNIKVGLADYVQPSLQGTKWGLGGTCVNVGCIPKKLLHHAANLGKIKQEQQLLGWDVSDKPFNWEQAISNINMYIKKLNFGYKSQLMKNNIQYFNAMASFENQNTIKLTDKNNEINYIEADKILIAIGGRPRYLDIEGCKEFCISSDDIFWMKKNPGKVLVIGAGYIALETAGFLNGFGNDVEVLYRSKVLRQFDNDAQKIKQFMENKGVQFTQGNPMKFIKTDQGIKVLIQLKDTNEQIEQVYDNILLAVGRDPLWSNLNLDKVGLEIDQQNKIQVDKKWQTSKDNIYAIGDIINQSLELTPVAIQEGIYLSEGLFNNNWQSLNYNSVATTLFTPLEYSYCGINEQQAIKQYKEDNIDVYHSHFTPLENSISKNLGDNTCYTKIIVHKQDRVVLGIHYFGPNAGEIMQGFALAIHLNIKYEDLKSLVGIHPTIAEELVNLQFTKRENPEAKKDGC